MTVQPQVGNGDERPVPRRKDGLYGAFHTYVGEEAIAVGTISALNDDDYIASTHRGHGHLIAKGGDLNKMSAEIFFKATGYNKGYGGSMHITDMSKGIMGMNGIVGASYYMAAGAAIRAPVRTPSRWRVAFFGDGASASPYYFSAVRSCANLKMPCIFVNENNSPVHARADGDHGADQVHHRVHQGSRHPAPPRRRQRCLGGVRGDAGSHRMGAGRQGPEMIEGITYRWPTTPASPAAGSRQDAREGTALPLRRRAASVDLAGSERALQGLAARRKALASEAELAAIDPRRKRRSTPQSSSPARAPTRDPGGRRPEHLRRPARPRRPSSTTGTTRPPATT